MAHQSRMQKYQPRREKRFGVLDTTDTGRKAMEVSLVTNTLWRQIDRWVNEGGAVGDEAAPFTQEGSGSDRTQKQFGSRRF